MRSFGPPALPFVCDRQFGGRSYARADKHIPEQELRIVVLFVEKVARVEPVRPVAMVVEGRSAGHQIGRQHDFLRETRIERRHVRSAKRGTPATRRCVRRVERKDFFRGGRLYGRTNSQGRSKSDKSSSVDQSGIESQNRGGIPRKKGELSNSVFCHVAAAVKLSVLVGA